MAKKKRIIYTNRPWEATGICSGCRLCELWCSVTKNGSFNPHRSRIRVVELNTGIDIPVTCQQCENPACQASCQFEALTYDEKLKIVVVDDDKCTGCQACVGACPYGIITIDPATNKAIKCDLCGGGEPVCVSICPSNVLSALGDIKTGEYNRRRFAALLAFDDEVQRNVPGGEDPTQKMLEKRG
ncbi:MAG: 4Fe-4S dicluster domain-containing protein [Deltaproteobacteria bacterium]|nr:4Fe-4S dicluster domain-containing protein [Deltaproteobacteria bacterium]